MTNVRDLHIDKELLTLFDFTQNDNARAELKRMLAAPLPDVAAIMQRQQILKAFAANNDILNSFSYARVDAAEVYDYLRRIAGQPKPAKGLRWQLMLSATERHFITSRLAQLAILFHKFQQHYFSRLHTDTFPEGYRQELRLMNDFLTGFNPAWYDRLVREQEFKIRHVVALAGIVAAKTESGDVERFWQRFSLFEAYVSIANGIVKHRFTFPIFTAGRLVLQDFYHPLLTNPVVNTIDAAHNVILLTGPNMSGKSTLLRAVSLCVYLGHLGLAVPAGKAELPYFDTIAVHIDLNDDMASGYSHFMTEVSNLKKVVTEAAAGRACFAVFDELFRGTNIEDALEITTITIKGMLRFTSSLFFISTHLHQLCELDVIKNKEAGSYYIVCEVKGNKPAFTYKLAEGWSVLKIGRILFAQEGLDQLLG